MENDKKPINTNIQNYKLTCNIFEKLKPSYTVLIYHSDSRKIANQVFSMLRSAQISKIDQTKS